LVSEFAVAELATALGLSAGSGRTLVAQALELAHRLPKVWARVRSGSLAPWRARRIAEETLVLSMEAAAWVDQMVARFAHKTGPAQTQRLVQDAIAKFMPEHAAQRREAAAETRYFAIEHDQVSFAGTSRVHGELDLADALDLEDAVTAGAQQLAALGHTESLDVRRSLAAGVLARGQQPLDLIAGGFETGARAPSSTTAEAGDAVATVAEPTVVEEVAQQPSRNPTGPSSTREVVLYVHLTEDAITTGHPDTPVWVENAGGQLLTAAQIADWCGLPDTRKVTVKPVIDLNQPHAVDGYQVPARIAEHVRLRDRTCVHPWCQRPARRCDLDHLDPYVPIDQGGPPGQTSTDNLACLCRLHHRMKTHSGWNYQMTHPGVFLWTSPHGHRYLRDHTGTPDLTPTPADPPAQPPADPPAQPPADPPHRRAS
jgi:hypothetical protein